MIGLVDDGDLHLVELHDALAHEVFEASRASDDDVDAAAEGLFLAGLLDAAEDGGDGEADGGRERLDDSRDLGGQFTGRRQDEAGGGTDVALDLHLGESGDQRDGEGEGLARAGLAAAEDVLAVEGVGQGVGLDREGVGLALRCQNLDQFCWYAEGFEGNLGSGGVGGSGVGDLVCRCRGGLEDSSHYVSRALPVRGTRAGRQFTADGRCRWRTRGYAGSFAV